MLPTNAAALARCVGASFFLHRWLIGLILAYIAIAVLAAAHIGRSDALHFAMYETICPSALAILSAAGCLRALVLLARQRPARPSLFLAREFRVFLSAERLLAALPIMVVLPPFMSVFTGMKNLVPVFNPYRWDPALMALDRTLHGGTDPWRILQPLVGHLWTSISLGWCYQLWFVFIFGAWIWQAFSLDRPRLRMQYFLAAAMAWAIVGSFGAVAFSSGGPAFYGRLVAGGDPFAPLMAYLHGVDRIVPLHALRIQDYLWNDYLSGHGSIGSGIAAMPSMHVSSTFLFALLLRNLNRTLGRIGIAYLALIMIGSVHLGWHYAVDGYVSIPITLLLWRLAGWIVSRMPEFAGAAPRGVPQPVPA